MGWTIRLCGPVGLDQDGQSRAAALPGRQGRLLFAYLVLNRDRDCGRAELIDLLWPERPPAAADSALSALLAELRRALGDGALELHYQPIVNAEGTKICGVEALLRWDHPTRGPIPPNVFVPVAEQTGLMEALGEFVLRKALADAMRWPNLYIAINVSPVEIRSRGFVDLIACVMKEIDIAPSRVVVEVK